MMLTLTIVLVLIVSEDVIGLPCLTNESKEDFDKSRKALIVVQSDTGKVVNTLESNYQQTIKILESTLKNNLGTFKSTLNSMGQKLKKLDTDFKVLGKDFRKTKWIKYDGHCYYYSSEPTDWFTAERKCREIGGYLVKLDNDGEMKNIYSNANKNYNHWIGMTELKEGEFRWTYDWSKAVIKDWYPGYGSKGTSNNCGAVGYSGGKLRPFDYICAYSSGYRYICESNFCF